MRWHLLVPSPLMRIRANELVNEIRTLGKQDNTGLYRHQSYTLVIDMAA